MRILNSITMISHVLITLNISDVVYVRFVSGGPKLNFGTWNGGSPGGILFDAENGRRLYSMKIAVMTAAIKTTTAFLAESVT